MNFVVFVWLELKIRGVKSYGCSFWNGFPFISKEMGSSIAIMKGCRFASRHTGNPLGINHKCMISTIKKDAIVEIGNYCSFSGVAISCAVSIKLDDYVRCGNNVMIMDHDGHEDDFRSGRPKPIVIGDHVWIGANAVIMKDVKVGRFAMIGTGAIVRNNIPPYAIAIGNPAKVVGFSKTPDEIEIYEKKVYSVEERLSLDMLEKNYKKYFLERLEFIKQLTRL